MTAVLRETERAGKRREADLPRDTQRTTERAGIDVHCHLFPKSYLDFVRQLNRAGDARLGTRLYRKADGVEWLANPDMPEYPMVPDFWDPDAVVAWMDQAGLAHAVLTPHPPCLSYWAPVDVGREVTAAINEGMAAAARAHPDRFSAGASVTIADPQHAADELTDAVHRLGLRTAIIPTNVNGRNLDEPEFFPFFACAAELGVPVLIHPNPFHALGWERLERYYLHNVVGMTADTTVAIASLIFGGVLERLPTLKLLFPHGGGAFTALRGRMDHAYEVKPEARAQISQPPSAYFHRLYFDTLTHDAAVLKHLIETAAPGHVILGSDFPSPMGTRHPRETLAQLEQQDDATYRAVLEGNARTLFGLT
jgi:aminocarboxymuconate-semialdehyde decarboxylase